MSTFAGGKRTIYQINASGGALVSIVATAGSRKVVIQECPPEDPPGASTYNGANFAPQGSQYTLPDDGFVQIFPLLPDDQLVFENHIAQGRGAGSFQGGPAQTDPGGRTIPARIYCKLISATATATQVLVIEYA